MPMMPVAVPGITRKSHRGINRKYMKTPTKMNIDNGKKKTMFNRRCIFKPFFSIVMLGSWGDKSYVLHVPWLISVVLLEFTTLWEANTIREI